MPHRFTERHIERHRMQRSGWLRAAVLGANDGIISVSSLVIGIASADTSQSYLLLSGITALVAGAMSMAAGEYVSVSSQSDTENADLERERRELVEMPAVELNELTQIYVERGVKTELARQVAAQMMKKDALGVHAREELGISEITAARPLQAALASAGAFSLGAIFPVIAALAIPLNVFVPVSFVLCIALLGALGAFAAKIGGAPPLKPALRVMFWGAAAMALSAVIGNIMGVTVS
ncbi:MAG TPA: VIT family protein [Micavibrio sp.]|nr:VIT family protein [Micavibrio sp.]